jgi:hypothetical protein
MYGGEPFHRITTVEVVFERDGAVVRVTGPDTFGPQAQAHIERDGTFVFLSSETLNSDRLATIAARLKPAPRSGGIQ